MKPVFVVVASSGYGDMHHGWMVAAHATAEAAEAHRVLAQEAADELLNRREAQGECGWLAEPTRYDLAFESWGGDRVFYAVKALLLCESALPANGLLGALQAYTEARTSLLPPSLRAAREGAPGPLANCPAEGSFGDKLTQALRS